MNFVITKIGNEIAKENDFAFLEIQKSLLTNKHKYLFKMFDDDYCFFFEGFSKQDFSFVPLDETAQSNDCTEILYLVNKSYKQL